LDELTSTLRRFVVLPNWGTEAMALWILHTYAFELRDVSTYVGIESPEKRCGKTTLLGLLSELVNRPVVAANISSPAFFRVIEETRPTLLIDEADTFLQGNDELRGILNSGYAKKTAFVVRMANECAIRNSNEENSKPWTETFCAGEGGKPGRTTQRDRPYLGNGTQTGLRLARFSSWCPKAVAAIGRLPETLADRCIVVRMQRKTVAEKCERLKSLDGETLRRKCARFVLDHAEEIRSAQPSIPEAVNDRAADIWEPLFALADLAGKELFNHKDRIEHKEGDVFQPRMDTDSHRLGLGPKSEIRTGSSGGQTKQIQNSNRENLETEANGGKEGLSKSEK
jgi:hypothetical protein